MTVHSQRTPDARFNGPPDCPFEPHHVAIDIRSTFAAEKAR